MPLLHWSHACFFDIRQVFLPKMLFDFYPQFGIGLLEKWISYYTLLLAVNNFMFTVNILSCEHEVYHVHLAISS